MSKKLYEESDIQAIANAIRTKNGLSDTYLVSEMAAAILAIVTGGGSNVQYQSGTFSPMKPAGLSSYTVNLNFTPELFIAVINGQPLFTTTSHVNSWLHLYTPNVTVVIPTDPSSASGSDTVVPGTPAIVTGSTSDYISIGTNSITLTCKSGSYFRLDTYKFYAFGGLS